MRFACMALPTQLQEDFVAESTREPLYAVRANCDLEGKDGLTWIATEGTMLVCYAKPAGGEFSRALFRLSEASVLTTDEMDNQLAFRARFPEADFTVKLLPGEAMAVSKIIAIQPASDVLTGVGAPQTLTPHLVCAAAVFAMVAVDGKHSEQEVDWVIDRFGNLNSFRRGGAWMAKFNFATLLTEGGRLLTLVQKESLLFNLLELALADNLLPRTERGMLEEWRTTLGITEDRYQFGFDALLAQVSLSILVNETSNGPDWVPMNLMCACMLAVIARRPDGAERRLKELERRTESLDAINAGQTYLDQLETSGMLDMMPHLLSAEQRRCVLLNVFAEVYLHGPPVAESQTFVQQLGQALEFNVTDLGQLGDLYRSLGDRALFREAGTAAK